MRLLLILTVARITSSMVYHNKVVVPYNEFRPDHGDTYRNRAAGRASAYNPVVSLTIPDSELVYRKAHHDPSSGSWSQNQYRVKSHQRRQHLSAPTATEAPPIAANAAHRIPVNSQAATTDPVNVIKPVWRDLPYRTEVYRYMAPPDDRPETGEMGPQVALESGLSRSRVAVEQRPALTHVAVQPEWDGSKVATESSLLRSHIRPTSGEHVAAMTSHSDDVGAAADEDPVSEEEGATEWMGMEGTGATDEAGGSAVQVSPEDTSAKQRRQLKGGPAGSWKNLGSLYNLTAIQDTVTESVFFILEKTLHVYTLVREHVDLLELLLSSVQSPDRDSMWALRTVSRVKDGLQRQEHRLRRTETHLRRHIQQQ